MFYSLKPFALWCSRCRCRYRLSLLKLSNSISCTWCNIFPKNYFDKNVFLLFSPICCNYCCYYFGFFYPWFVSFLAVVFNRRDRKSMFQLLSYCSYCKVLSKTGYNLPSAEDWQYSTFFLHSGKKIHDMA